MRTIPLVDEKGEIREDAAWQVLAHGFFPDDEASIPQAVWLMKDERARFLEMGEDAYRPSLLAQTVINRVEKRAVQMTLCGYVALAMIFLRQKNPRISVNGAAEVVARMKPEQGHFRFAFEMPDGSLVERQGISDPNKIRLAFRQFASVAHIHAARLVSAYYLTPRQIVDVRPPADWCAIRTAAAIHHALMDNPRAPSWDMWALPDAAPGGPFDDYPALEIPLALKEEIMR